MSEKKYFFAVCADSGNYDYDYGSFSLSVAMRMYDEECVTLASQYQCTLGALPFVCRRYRNIVPRICIIDVDDDRSCVGFIWHRYDVYNTPWDCDTVPDVYLDIDPDHLLIYVGDPYDKDELYTEDDDLPF